MAFELTFDTPIEETEEIVTDVATEEKPVEEEVLEEQEEPIEEEIEETEEEVIEIDEDNYPSTLNNLVNLGFITDIPEGIDPDKIGAEEAKTILQHRDSQLIQAAAAQATEAEQKRIVSKLNPVLHEVMAFNLDNPNASKDEVLEFIDSMTNVGRITELDPERDSEKIIREYNKTLGRSSEDITEIVNDLVELGKLEKEATKLKPLLDQKALSIIQKKNADSEYLRKSEEEAQMVLKDKTVQQLNLKTVSGIPITAEDQQYLYSVIMNNEVPVNIKGRKVEVGHLEALILHEKHSPKGNIENVMLAALVLRDGVEGMTKFLATNVKNTETEKIVKGIKFSNHKKTSVKSAKQASKTEPFSINF